MRAFSTMLVAVLGGLLILPQAVNAATSSGFDTVSGNQIFAVEGTKVGEWSSSQLAVTGGFAASGAVQVGQTTATCTSAILGSLRYNKSLNQAELCTDKGWVPLGGDRSGSWCGHFSASTVGIGCLAPWTPTFIVDRNCEGATTTKISTGMTSGYRLVSCPAGYSLYGISEKCWEETVNANLSQVDIHRSVEATCMKD